MSYNVSEENNGINVKDSNLFPCNCCGSNMHFDPNTQCLHCQYCGNKQEIDANSQNIKEYDFEAGESLCSTNWGSEIKVIHCDNCGAETVLENNNTAQCCAFCNSSHVVKIDEIPGISPESLIPFKFQSNKAREKFSTWLKGKFFAPKNLKSLHQIDHLMGIYIPYWTFDANTKSNYDGEKGTYYYVNKTVTVRRNGKNETQTKRVRKTRWSFTSGTYEQFYDDQLVHASQRDHSILLDKLMSYNLKELVEYRPEYLSGFVAEKYSIGLKDSWGRAKELIDNKIRQGVTKQINGDEVRNLNINTTYDAITYKHILLPVWVSSFRYKDKTYQFVINGQTGEIQGSAPVSIPKIIGVILLTGATIGIILKILGYI